MNILGVGGWELLIIFIIVLVVAGPKRMIHWSYLMGKYIGRLRQMWGEAVDMLQKEIDDAGVDIKIPKEPPTRQNIRNQFNQQVRKSFEPVTKPVQDTLQEVKSVRNNALASPENANSANASAKQQSTGRDEFGTWSGTAASPDASGSENQ